MNQLLNANEKELVKLVTFFKKRAARLMQEGKLSEEHQQVISACDNLVEKLNIHATTRDLILRQREELAAQIKDNALCPKCGRNTHLKLVGNRKHEKGWKHNVYKCRRCNIEFNWNQPNNPWDMVLYLEQSKQNFAEILEKDGLAEDVKQNSLEIMEHVEEGLAKLRDVIEVSDTEYENLQVNELNMSKLLHDFKNHLLIEKIKMDAWNDPTGLS
jgi:hypothetical protein